MVQSRVVALHARKVRCRKDDIRCLEFVARSSSVVVAVWHIRNLGFKSAQFSEVCQVKFIEDVFICVAC